MKLADSMNIKGTSSYITVEIDNKTVKIQGEMLTNGFLFYTDTIIHWEPPFDECEIDQNTRDRIIKAIIYETNDSKFKLVFE